MYVQNNTLEYIYDNNSMMVINPKTEEAFSLNKISSQIVKLLEQPKSFEEIMQSLLKNCSGSEIQIRYEVVTFLKKAVAEQIIMIS